MRQSIFIWTIWVVVRIFLSQNCSLTGWAEIREKISPKRKLFDMDSDFQNPKNKIKSLRREFLEHEYYIVDAWARHYYFIFHHAIWPKWKILANRRWGVLIIVNMFEHHTTHSYTHTQSRHSHASDCTDQRWAPNTHQWRSLFCVSLEKLRTRYHSSDGHCNTHYVSELRAKKKKNN